MTQEYLRPSRLASSALCSLAAIAIVVCAASAQWVQQGPFPTHRDIQGIEFVDGTEGWFVANDGPDHGSIWHTVDGGASWVEQYVSRLDRLEMIEMIDASNGWAIGADLVHTTDGGNTWNFANLPPLGVTGNYIQFVSPTHGWLSTRPAGWTNYLYRTTNGGLTWDYLGEFWVGPWMFVDQDFGWAIDAAQGVIRTTNGGLSWTDVGDPSGMSIDSAVYWAFSQDRVMVRTFDAANLLRWWITEDAGATWTQVSGNAGTKPVFVDENTGYSIYWYDVMTTTNGGYSWSVLGGNVGAKSLLSVGVSGDRVLAGGYYGFLTELDGSSWSQLSNGTGQLLRDISFVGSDLGWAVGDDFGLLETVDGGENWHHVFLPGDRRDLHEVRAFTASWVYARGGTSHYVTTDGVNWNEATWWPSGISYFSDPSNGWILEGDHTLHRTTDGGVTWAAQSVSGITGYGILRDLHFVNDSTGYLVALWDLIYRTTDGGATWSILPHPNTVGSDYRYVDFADTQNGWVAGSDGLILRTTNGGNTWVDQTLTDYREILDLEVVGADEALVCGGDTGGYGFVRHTTDGLNWPSLYVNDDSIQYGISVTPGNAWTCGVDGRIDHLVTEIASTPVNDLPDGTEPFLSVSAYPNPARRDVAISFRLKNESTVTLGIFDITGRSVRSLATRSFGAGVHEIHWDGRDDTGGAVANGRYFVRVDSGDGVDTIPVLILR
ncbi:MAG: YCF48-related protein [Candidatus Eisenbacteria bacterium]